MKVIVNGKFLTQNVSGVQRYAMEMSKQLKAKVPDILFLTPRNVLHTALAQTLEAEVIGHRTGHLWEQVDLPLCVTRRFGKKKYVLLNFTNTAPLLCPRNLLTLHDITFLKFASSYSFLFSTYYKLIVPQLVKRAVALFTVSETARKELEDQFGLAKGKIQVTYNAIDRSIFNDVKITNKKLQALLKNREAERYVLAVSMFNPIKNLTRLIASFQNAKLPNLKLVIVGEHYKSFKKQNGLAQQQANPNLVFLGRIDDAKALNFLYQNATAFAFPSLYESFGIPPLEAMASGCPVVVSNAGALSEVCADAAYYVNPTDVEDMTKGLKKMMNDEVLRRRLIQKGKERVLQFSWEQSANVVLQTLQQRFNAAQPNRASAGERVVN